MPPAFYLSGGKAEALAEAARCVRLEPLTLLAALAAVTKHVGLVSTATTTYNDPFNIARKFVTIDHISKGRAGWNLVTSQNVDEAQNFGFDQHMDHAQRYQRAQEFYDVVTGLWDSWEDDVIIREKASGRYIDAKKLHVLNHEGAHFFRAWSAECCPLAARLSHRRASRLIGIGALSLRGASATRWSPTNFIQHGSSGGR